MNQELFRSEGIVLHLIKLGDYDQLATIFTPDAGVIKLVIKGGMSLKRHRSPPISPLTRAEFVYSLGKGELHPCTEVTPSQRYHHSESSYANLEAACALTQAIRQSQMLEKPSPGLYALLKIYLHELNNTKHPDPWTSSFFLKILKHEGLLGDLHNCSACGSPIENAYMSRGEAFCSTHAPVQPIILSADEVAAIEILTHIRSTKDLAACTISDPLGKKIKALFNTSFD